MLTSNRITGFLKCPIGIGSEGAVFEDQIFAITKGLGAGDTATDKAEIAGIPAEVLAFDLGVIDRTVLGFPKGIFGIKNSVVDLDVAGVLENVLANQPNLADR